MRAHEMNYLIKEVNDVNEFLDVYKVFRLEPYNELWPDEEIQEEFANLKKLGKVFGYYIGNKCAGIIAYYDIVRGEHPVEYPEDLKVLYFSDVAVLEEYRNKGIATKLLNHMMDFAKENAYDVVYMRTMQPDKSMSYSIVVKYGFKVMNGILEDKSMVRSDGNEKSDSRIFLEYKF